MSTDERLSQEFNSLDAQRESALAYIASQKCEGWTLHPERYDDGGFTGANMDRPALKRLVADIQADNLDCVLVYKADRLSRSLTDFVRVMETFEKHGVSFVSVTQPFNTATSMGQLTLNMLLSFAQFERELVSERTKDKIAAARRKGMWAGGRPILGYDLKNGKLAVNPEEAERVRGIFDLYLEKQSLNRTVAELAARGWTTKRWVTRAGEAIGGRSLDKGLLQRLITNVAYLGKVRHLENVYPGQHEAIVAPEKFDSVAKLLASNAASTNPHVRNMYGALLKGMLFCVPCGKPMTHSFTNKGGNRCYRYYVCHKAQVGGWHACPSPSLPAEEVERFVLERVRELTASRPVVELLRAQAASWHVPLARAQSRRGPDLFEELWERISDVQRGLLLRMLVGRVEYDGGKGEIGIVMQGESPAKESESARRVDEEAA